MGGKQTKYVKDFVKTNDKNTVQGAFIIYWIRLAVMKGCRKCIRVLDKHQKSNNQDLDEVLDLKQYCPKCQNIIKGLHKKLDNEVKKVG